MVLICPSSTLADHAEVPCFLAAQLALPGSTSFVS
jgi:hypothetical protein